MKLGFCERSETKTIVELIPVSEAIREGRRRDKDDWTYTLTSEPALFADRGFTGHEYLKYFNLYNMNGRMYDPLVGRFISPDPYVQAPNMTQSMNRYTYCMNNPLVYVDYNGYTWFTKLGAWIGKSGQTIAMIGVTVGVSLAVVASCGTLTPLAVAVIAGAASGAVGGALGAAFQGGDVWHGALSGGASGAVSGLIGGTLGKWAVKGLQNWGINGLTKYANSPVIKSALASGISSAASGGVTAFATELALGGSLNDAINAGANGAILGFAIGAYTGGRAGRAQARDLGIDPWTGKPKSMPNTRNGHLAGNTHPETGVPFDSDGFPDFKDHLYNEGINDVMIEPTGNRAADFSAANKVAGYSSTPKGYTWHHNQTTGRMQLVESLVHLKTGHTGGFSLWKY